MPEHHVPDVALFDHVMTGRDPALSLAIACHLGLCARCKHEERGLAELGDALAESALASDGAIDPSRPSATDGAEDRGRVRLLSAIQDLPPHDSDAPVGSLALPRDLLPFTPPRPLARALAALARPRWRYLAPGTRGIALTALGSDQAGSTAHLVRLRPGMRIPRHDHGAVEATIVFTGALLEGDERYGPGDIRFRDPGETHAQRVDRPEVCVALVVNAGKLVPLNLTGRLLKLIARP